MPLTEIVQGNALQEAEPTNRSIMPERIVELQNKMAAHSARCSSLKITSEKIDFMFSRAICEQKKNKPDYNIVRQIRKKIAQYNDHLNRSWVVERYLNVLDGIVIGTEFDQEWVDRVELELSV